MKFFKLLLIVAVIIAISQFVFRNFHLLRNADEALIEEVTSRDYADWRVNFLLWRGAAPYYKHGQAYEAMLMFKHYDLIERFGEKIPEKASNEMYKISQQYVKSEQVDERIRKSLRIESK